MRAQHGINDMPDIMLFRGTRYEYEKFGDKEAMTDRLEEDKVKICEIYDRLAWESGLLVKRPDYDEAVNCFNKYQRKWEEAKAKCDAIRRDKDGIPEDINEFGKARQDIADIDEILSYLSWSGTALPGWIYSKSTPRNAGRLFIRCSDARGECFGQVPVEQAHMKLECGCGYIFCMCQRSLTMLPPRRVGDGNQLYKPADKERFRHNVKCQTDKG